MWEESSCMMISASTVKKYIGLIGRALVLLSYVLCMVVAFGDSYFPSSLVDPMNDTRVNITSIIMATLAVIGFFAVFTHRWRWEWVPANALTCLLLARACPLWFNLQSTPTYLSAAAMMTLGAFCLAKRALDLALFFEETRLAAHLKD